MPAERVRPEAKPAPVRLNEEDLREIDQFLNPEERRPAPVDPEVNGPDDFDVEAGEERINQPPKDEAN